MTDAFELLKERDDVVKTEYQRQTLDRGKITVELWHNAEGLQNVAEEALTRVTSTRAMQECAKQHAIVVRETVVDESSHKVLESLYPELMDEFESE